MRGSQKERSWSVEVCKTLYIQIVTSERLGLWLGFDTENEIEADIDKHAAAQWFVLLTRSTSCWLVWFTLKLKQILKKHEHARCEEPKSSNIFLL